MRDISRKITTLRSATAQATLKISPDTYSRLKSGDLPKGDPLPVAKVAAIQAAKKTDQLIPYCHPIPIEAASIEFEVEPTEIRILGTVKAIYKTGVEMEALSAVSVAALTLYDMLKMLDDSMEIGTIRLLRKEGGKSDAALQFGREFSAAVLTISDSISDGNGLDTSGEYISRYLGEQSIDIIDYQIVPDDPSEIISCIKHYTDDLMLDLVITTGGTGLGPRDNTPEALELLFDKEAPGISETLRAYGQARTPYAMLSRSKAGMRKNSLIISLPGSTKAVQEAMDVLFPYVLHAFQVMRGERHTALQLAVGKRP